MMLEGVGGREAEMEVMGWNAGPESGDKGRRLPNTGESAVSGVGEVSPFRARSSGVNRPLGVRLMKRGEVEGEADTAGDVGREVREVDAGELARCMLDAKL